MDEILNKKKQGGNQQNREHTNERDTLHYGRKGNNKKNKREESELTDEIQNDIATLSPQIESNTIEICKGFKIDHKPMTFKEADGKTPNLCNDDENCQSCVLVYEARRGGVNVTALPYAGKGSISHDLGDDIALAFRDKNGAAVRATIIRGNEEKIKADLKKKLSEIGRYHIGINRKNGY